MTFKKLSIREALNKAFLRMKPGRNEIDNFKEGFIKLTNQINEKVKEGEEFHKNLVSDFLKDTYYKNKYFINTKGSIDLAIHNGKDANSSVGVIIEAKSPSNKYEMLKHNDINAKALHELVLYYLRERMTNKNLEIRHLIATNINEWFIFDAGVFEKAFFDNRKFRKDFNEFESGRLSGKKTELFYNEIAKPFIDKNETEIEFTYFNISEYEKFLKNGKQDNDKKLIPLFKIFSPEHLLKLPFINDSNTLDKTFYSELLHIIGLTEIKKGTKKFIEREQKGNRNSGSLLENAIIQIEALDKTDRLKNPEQFGKTYQEKAFYCRT